MVVIKEEWFMYINIAVILFIVLSVMIGYKTGFIRRTVSLFGTFVSFYGAWFLSDTFSHYISLMPKNLMPAANVIGTEALYQFLNQVCWYGVLFLVIKFLFFLLDLIIKSVQRISVVKTLSGILGSILGFLESIVLILVACSLLTSPFFVGGKETVQGTVLGPIKDLTVSLFEEYLEPVVDADAFSQLVTDVQDLTEDQKGAVEYWLQTHGYKKDAPKEEAE
jgi:uncharacterized membrane protein required for colicin V production